MNFCYICFTRNHHFKDCIYAVPSIFLPNIDQILFTRFVETLIIEEKRFLIFTYPSIFNELSIKPIKVLRRKIINFSNLPSFLKLDLIVADKAYVYNSSFRSLISRTAFRIQHLEIISSNEAARLKLSSNELFLLLTFKAKAFRCVNVNFEPKVIFRQIVEAAPILKKIDIHQTDIEVNNEWVDLLDNLRNLQIVSFAINDLNISVEDLAALIQKKKSHFMIDIYLIPPTDKDIFDEDTAFKAIQNQLLSHFFYDRINDWPSPLRICYKYDSVPPGFFKFRHFKLWEH